MSGEQEMLDKQTYKTMRKEYKRGIKVLKKATMKLQENSRVVELKSLIDKKGHIAKLGYIDLYRDHITKSGSRAISFTSSIDVQFSISGDVYTTTTGGGSRPTLTRVVAGGLIAGPLGAVIGGAAQKHQQTNTKVHDDRKVEISVSGDGGYIAATFPITNEQLVRNFVETVMNTSHDYQKHAISNEKYMTDLLARLASADDSIGLTKTAEELQELQSQKSTLEKDWKEQKGEYYKKRSQRIKDQRAARIEKAKQSAGVKKQERLERIGAKSLESQKIVEVKKQNYQVLEAVKPASVAKAIVEPVAKEPKQLRPFYQRAWFLILMFVVITPVGVFLWFKYFRHPHISIKIIVSILWLFWWGIFTIATIQVATGHSTDTTNTSRSSHATASR